MRAGSSRMSLRAVRLAGVAATVLAVFGCGGKVLELPGNTASLSKSSSATPIGEHGNGASAMTSAPATASAGDSPLPRPSGGVASASVDSASSKPMSPSIVFRGQASTATEFRILRSKVVRRLRSRLTVRGCGCAIAAVAGGWLRVSSAPSASEGQDAEKT